MPHYMYVALQEDDKISVHTIDPQTGKLTPQAEVSVPPAGRSLWRSARIGNSSTPVAAIHHS